MMSTAAGPIDRILRIHHAGDFSADDVSTAWADSTWSAPPEIQRLIDDAWERAMIEPNRQLFDGPMCRMESWNVTGGKLAVALSRTSYRVFWATNIMHPELADRFGPEVMANPVGVSPALETGDGFLLLGRRNERVAYYPSRIHPFAGCVEPPNSPDAAPPDLFAEVRRELDEELRLSGDDVETVRLRGVVEDRRLRQPELIFRVKTPLSRSAVEARLDATEHRGVYAIRAEADAVAAAMARPDLTPVAVASLLLWGLGRWGVEWPGAKDFALPSPAAG